MHTLQRHVLQLDVHIVIRLHLQSHACGALWQGDHIELLELDQRDLSSLGL